MAPSSLPCTVPLRYTVICSRSLAWSSVTRAGWPVTAPCSLTCASWSPWAMVHTSTSTWCLLLVGLVGRIVEVGKQRLAVQRPRLGEHLGDPFDVFHRPFQRRRQLQGRGRAAQAIAQLHLGQRLAPRRPDGPRARPPP